MAKRPVHLQFGRQPPAIVPPVEPPGADDQPRRAGRLGCDAAKHSPPIGGGPHVQPHVRHSTAPQNRAPIQPSLEEYTSELQSLLRISYAVVCLKTTTFTIACQTCTFHSPISSCSHRFIIAH